MERFGYKFGMELETKDVIRLMKQEFNLDITEENINIMDNKDQAIVHGIADKIEYAFFVKYSSVNIQKIDTRNGVIVDYRKEVRLWNV